MALNWYPIIDESKCIHCLKCFQHCCKSVYAVVDGKPVVAHPERCAFHGHGCGSICPVGAIHYFGDDTGWVPPHKKGNETRKEEKKMKIQALGGCCQKSTKNYENAVAAVKEMGLKVEVEHVTDMDEIMNLGVMATPGLVINGKVCAAGRVLTVAQIKAFIEQFKEAKTTSCGCEDGSCDCEDGSCDCEDGKCEGSSEKCDCETESCGCESGKCGC